MATGIFREIHSGLLHPTRNQMSDRASEVRSGRSRDRWLVLGVCLFLAAGIWLVLGQAIHFEFIGFDDVPYVVKNPQVNRGLTTEGFVWAFSRVHSGNWHPLTWLSHMLDCQLY